MNVWHAVILGIVEGLTEFLPVSSTGHLILAARLLGLAQSEFMKTFEIAIQVGAIAAVFFVYWRSFLTSFQTLLRVGAAFIPTAVVGYVLYKIIKKFFFSGTDLVLWMLLLGGIAILLFERWYRESPKADRDSATIPLPKAIAIGLAQSLAVVPGVSRSAATVIGGLCFGLDRRTAVEFSFLLAAPTLLAATALDLWKTPVILGPNEWNLLLIGGGVSFLVAILSMKLFLSFVQKRGLAVFGMYRILVAIVFWSFVR